MKPGSVLTAGIAVDMGAHGVSVSRRMREIAPLLEAAEDGGFESVWFGEGYATHAEDPRGFHLASALMLVAAMADRTRLRLGTGVTLVRAWHPMRIAYEAALADQITGGRLSLGLGLGPDELEERFETHYRSAEVDQALATIRKAWADGSVWPLPEQPGGPPMLVAGGAARSAVRAARFGDGWYASTGYRRSRIADLAGVYWRERNGRPGLVAANRVCAVSDGNASSYDRVEEAIDDLLGSYRSFGTTERGRGGETSQSALRDDLALCGSPDDVARGIERLVACGVTSIQFRVAPPGVRIEDAVKSVNLLASQVLPRWRLARTTDTSDGSEAQGERSEQGLGH